MKSKWIVGILMVVSLICCGHAYAESTNTVESAKATAEDAVLGSEDSLNTIVEDGNAASDELYSPAAEPVKAEAAEVTEESKKM